MMKFLIFLSVLSVGYSNKLINRPTQSVEVQGFVKCNGQPAKDVMIRVYDHDTFTQDDKMTEGPTDSEGFFKLIGTANEFTSIKPYVKILGDKGDKACHRTINKDIPKKYVTNGSPYPRKIFDLGVVDLAKD